MQGDTVTECEKLTVRLTEKVHDKVCADSASTQSDFGLICTWNHVLHSI